MGPNELTPMENFLRSFHLENPSCTSLSFANGYTTDRLTSYDQLLKAVETPSLTRGHLLDLACGDGFLLKKISTTFPDLKLSGIDMSEGELSVAKEILGSLNVSLIQAKAQQLPFSNSKFDFILCHMALMLMDNLEQVIQEIHRCLIPSGVFSAIVGGNFKKNPVFSKFLELLDEALKAENKFWLKDLGDPRTRSIDGIRALFAKDFVQIEMDDFEVHFYDHPDALTNFFLLMYDVGLLSKERRHRLSKDLLSELHKMSDSNGKVHHSFNLRQLKCRKRIE